MLIETNIEQCYAASVFYPINICFLGCSAFRVRHDAIGTFVFASDRREDMLKYDLPATLFSYKSNYSCIILLWYEKKMFLYKFSILWSVIFSCRSLLCVIDFVFANVYLFFFVLQDSKKMFLSSASYMTVTMG